MRSLAGKKALHGKDPEAIKINLSSCSRFLPTQPWSSATIHPTLISSVNHSCIAQGSQQLALFLRTGQTVEYENDATHVPVTDLIEPATSAGPTITLNRAGPRS